MGKAYGSLTVYFEEPFWVGIFEITENGRLSASKITFGSEPRDCEIYELILKGYYRLQFSPSVKADIKPAAKNPKKMQRDIKRLLQNRGTGTKSQQAVKLCYEQSKQKRKSERRTKKAEDKKRRFELKRQQKKARRRGK